MKFYDWNTSNIHSESLFETIDPRNERPMCCSANFGLYYTEKKLRRQKRKPRVRYIDTRVAAIYSPSV